MRVLVSLATVVMVAGVVPASPRQAAAFERAAVDGKPSTYLFWPARTIAYYLNKRGSADLAIKEVVGAVRRSFFSWASPSCTDLEPRFMGLDGGEQTNLTLGEGEAPDRKNLLIWREDQWPPAGVTDGTITKDMAAVTTLSYDADSGAIIDADIDLNGHDFFWTTSDDQMQRSRDVQNIVTHEVGHLLGLAHSKNAEATMFAMTEDAELKKRTLEQDDLDGICAIYPYGSWTPQGQVGGGCDLWGGAAEPTALAVPALALLLLVLRRRRGSYRLH